MHEKNFSKDKIVWRLYENVIPFAKLTIANNSNKTYGPQDSSFGVITNQYLIIEKLSDSGKRQTCKTIYLLDSRYLHVFSDFKENIFPNSYASLTFEILPMQKSDGNGFEKHDQNIHFRIYTSTGIRDYPMRIEYLTGVKPDSKQLPLVTCSNW